MRRIGYAALAALILGAAPAPRIPGSEVSPAAVLKRVDATLGSQSVTFAQRPEPNGPDKTLAPYFYVGGGETDTERLPLKETKAEVQIAGVIARVKVHQLFENSGTKPIEAVYVFPASTRAAVHGMRMRIGERTVEAKIEKKQAAREQYEQAKQQGKRASLLEQERPNVFTMRVANVMPRDRIEVELDYSELLVPEDATYEFVYPTVVGPRYGGGADPQKDQWIASPYLSEGEAEPYRFGIQVHLESAIPLKELSSPSHTITVNYGSKTSANVSLAQSGGGNRDFVLRYRLAGDQVETGLLLWQGQQENFFLLMMEPPQRPTVAQIPPREYIFLLDVSGSMHGFPLQTSQELMRNLLPQLRPTDTFNIATFSGGSDVLHPEGSLPATPANIQHAIGMVERLTGGGGTELMGGLQRAYAIPKKEQGVARTVVLVTDGYVGVEAQAFRFIREHLGEANLFAFGIGSSVNRGLIEGVARAGLGTPFVVLRPEKAKEEALRLQKYIQSPVLTNIQVSFPGFDAREVAPSKVPDVLAQRPVVLFGKFRGDPRGRIQISGNTGSGTYQKSIEVAPTLVKAENSPIRWLWARKWVEYLDDERSLSPAKELEEAITELGLNYSLLTSFTSFVAVDSEVVNRNGSSTTVAQPLPLPQGVSNLAVGGAPGSVTAVPLAPSPSASDGAARELAATPPVYRSSRLKKAHPAYSQLDETVRREAPKARLAIVEVKSNGMPDLTDLLREVEARIAKVSLPKTVQITLKLAIGKNGEVTRIEVVKSNDPSAAEQIRQQLGTLRSRSLPASGSGTVQLTFELVNGQ